MARKVPGEADVFDVPFEDEFDEPDEFDDAESPEDERVIEGSGWRIMPHPLTGKPTRFPRASSFGGHLSDEYVLNEWRKAMTALGLGMREDLYALAASTPRHLGPVELRPQGWWKPWAAIAEKAMMAAESASGAHKGTAIHSWGEQVDRGQIETADVPKQWAGHLENYVAVREAAEIRVNPDYLEIMVLTLKLHNGVCGRLDGLRDGPGGWLVVDDTKTGRQAPIGMDEICIQEAIYANAEWHWTGEDTPNYGWVPAPTRIRKDLATITWVPIDRPDASEVIPIDIMWGWQAAKVAAWVKRYQNRAKRKNNGLRLPLSQLHEIECRDCGNVGEMNHTPGCAFEPYATLCPGCGYSKNEGYHGMGLGSGGCV